MGNLHNESTNIHPILGIKEIESVQYTEYKPTLVEDNGFLDPDDYVVIPCRKGVLIKPYSKNIFNKYKTASGLILSSDVSFHKSKETGEVEQSEKAIMCGHVIEASPLCDIVEKGDDIYYFAPVSNPIPFGNKGYVLIDENNIFCKMKKKNDIL